MTRRAVTETDIRKAHEVFGRGAVKCFNQEGEVAPQVFLIVLDQEHEGKIDDVMALPPELAQKLHDSPRSKALLSGFIRSLLRPGYNLMFDKLLNALIPDHIRPDIIVHVTEAWLVKMLPGEDTALPPSEHPRRQEAVLCNIHTADKSYLGTHDILEDPRRCEYVPLELGMEAVGRMTMDDELKVTH